jgi:hypothetical protein
MTSHSSGWNLANREQDTTKCFGWVVETCDFHRVKVTLYAQIIDGKAVISRHNRQNRPNRRYLPQKCHKTMTH